MEPATKKQKIEPVIHPTVVPPLVVKNKYFQKPKKGKSVADFLEAGENKKRQWSTEHNVWPDGSPINPLKVGQGVDQPFWWLCLTCWHLFLQAPGNMTCHGNDCCYCAKTNGKLCADADCQHCEAKSVLGHGADSRVVKCWSIKNDKTPRQTFKSDNDTFLFDCNVCNHEFPVTMNHITNHGRWCGFCANKRLCPASANCETCVAKSFFNSPGYKFWDTDANAENPKELFMNRNKPKFAMKCDVDPKHTWPAKLNDITTGNGCPFCRNKTEQILYDILCGLFGKNNVVWQYKPDWIGKQHIDFYVLDRFCIELDGDQHRVNVAFFGNRLEYQQRLDRKKDKLVLENTGLKTIRLNQPDVWFDRNNWRMELEEIEQYYMSL